MRFLWEAEQIACEHAAGMAQIGAYETRPIIDSEIAEQPDLHSSLLQLKASAAACPDTEAPIDGRTRPIARNPLHFCNV
jgi:hypothetical protein